MLGADRKPDKKLVARLRIRRRPARATARLRAGDGGFAAQAKFDLGEKILLVPVGRAEIVPAADDGERQVTRSRPSLPIFTVEWAKALRANL